MCTAPPPQQIHKQTHTHTRTQTHTQYANQLLCTPQSRRCTPANYLNYFAVMSTDTVLIHAHHTHKPTHSYRHSPTHTSTPTNTHNSNAHPMGTRIPEKQSCGHTHTHRHKHTRTHTHTHTRTHTHTHTHAHTRTRSTHAPTVPSLHRFSIWNILQRPWLSRHVRNTTRVDTNKPLQDTVPSRVYDALVYKTHSSFEWPNYICSTYSCIRHTPSSTFFSKAKLSWNNHFQKVSIIMTQNCSNSELLWLFPNKQ